ncbi:MAG: hypothetical protein AB9897_03020 [Anaerolineaceae bacterium]
MEKTKVFLTKYGLYILIVGIVLLIISTSWMNNLPSPYYLTPDEANSKFYVPLRIARFLKGIGIVGLLIGAFIVIKNFVSIKNSIPTDTDNITKNIAASLFKNQSQSSTATNIPTGAVIMSANKAPAKSTVIEITKTLLATGYEYVYIDEKKNQIVGINSILNYFIQKGYRIVNTIETGSNEHSVMQIIIEE